MIHKTMLTVPQIKAARAILGMSQKQLASNAGIAVATLNNIERGAQTDPKTSTMRAIQHAFEQHGIAFLNDPIQGTGLYLKPKAVGPEEATILIVDDSRADRALYRSWLANVSKKRYHLVEAQSAAEGFEAFITHEPNCLILDFMMYGADGFQLLARLKKEPVALPPIIFVTGMHNEIMEENARQQGVHTYLNKQQMTREDLCDAVERALKSS